MAGYLHPDELNSTFHKSLFDLFGYDMTHDARIGSWVMVRSGVMGIPDGRNNLCNALLMSDHEWLFMVDSDMGFEPILLDQLLKVADAKERPIVGGLAFAQRETVPDGRNGFRCFPMPTILDWIQHIGPGTLNDGVWRFTGRRHYPVNSLVKCGSTGAACLVIHRSVLERMLERYGKHWWDRITGEKDEVMGEDISFFSRCKELDIPLHVHTGIRTTHFKHLWLAEEDFWQSFLAPPATDRVDVIVPVLHRPQNVKPFMESLIATTGLATAWFVCDILDIEEQAEARKYGGRLLFRDGTFAQKVNTAYKAVHDGGLELDAPWILLVGDDVRFRPGWLDHAMEVARRYSAKVVGTNDLLNPRVTRGEHATHMLIRRDYINELGASWDGPGIVAHEGYRHWFVDDEIVTAAKQRGVFQMSLASEVEHTHPINNGAEMDEVYAKGMEHTEEDKKLFESRFLAHTQSQNGAKPNRATRRARPKRTLVGAK
jgi:hypothetical protein